MSKVGFAGFLSQWFAAPDDRGAAAALSTLYVHLGRRSDAETAESLARQALHLTPGSIAALELLELVTPPDRRRALCARYEAFLAHDPGHGEAPRVREALIDLLLDCGHYDGALLHVAAQTLTSSKVPAPEIARACSVPPPGHEPLELSDEFDELDELDLEPYDDDDEYEHVDFESAVAVQ